jgi:hypothetical protein
MQSSSILSQKIVYIIGLHWIKDSPRFSRIIDLGKQMEEGDQVGGS